MNIPYVIKISGPDLSVVGLLECIGSYPLKYSTEKKSCRCRAGGYDDRARSAESGWILIARSLVALWLKPQVLLLEAFAQRVKGISYSPPSVSVLLRPQCTSIPSASSTAVLSRQPPRAPSSSSLKSYLQRMTSPRPSTRQPLSRTTP